jgi:hypothetical protein
MRPAFFRILGEDDLMDSVYRIMKHTGAIVSLDHDLRQLLYLASAVEKDVAAAAKPTATMPQHR